MKPPHNLRTIVVVAVIILTSLACSLEGPIASPTPPAVPTFPAPTAVPTTPAVTAFPTPTPVPTTLAIATFPAPTPVPATPAVPLGKEMRFAEQGFSFQLLPDYQLDTNFGVQMLAPGADPDTGPAFMLAGSRSTSGATAQSLIDELKSNEIEVGPASPAQVDGVAGLSAEIKRTTGGLLGRVVVVLVKPDQQFTAFAAAPENRWKAEISHLFEAVLASVKLFEMTEPAAGTAGGEPTPTTAPTPSGQPGASAEPVEIRQWASSAIASSEYGKNAWSAGQASGAPNSPKCANQGTAWAAARSNTVEWIELTFAVPVNPKQVNIHLTYNPTYITKMELFDIQGETHQIYSFEARSYPECPYIFSVNVTGAGFQAVGLKITIDQRQAPSWVEIDAVELVGLGEASQLPTQPGGSASGQGASFATPAGFLWRMGGEKAFDTHAQFPGLWGIDYDPTNDVIFAADAVYGIQVIEAQSKASPPEGQHLGQFEHADMRVPQDVKVDAEGKVYVASWASGKVLVFGPMGGGEPLVSFGERGAGNGQFGEFSPTYLAVGLDGRIYIQDSNKNQKDETYDRIQIFSPQGEWLKTINFEDEFFTSGGMDVGPDGNLYVVGFIGSRILKYSPDGKLLAELGEDAIRSVNGGAQGIALDRKGNIYLALWTGGLVKLDSKGTLLARWGVPVKDGEQPWPESGFYQPAGIAVLPDGSQVFFSDTSGNYTYLTAFTFK